MWNTASVTVKEYHADQGSVFTSAEFRDVGKKKDQKQSFAGTPAQFQNGSAERTIQTFSGLPSQCYCIALSAGLALCVYAQSSGCSAAVFLRKMAFLR